MEADIKFGLAIIESPLRMLFASSTEKDVFHLTDIDPIEYSERYNELIRSHERCTCPHFLFRIEPAIRAKTILPDTPQSRCKHIKFVRENLVNKCLNLNEENCQCQEFQERIKPLLESGAVKPLTQSGKCQCLRAQRDQEANQLRDAISERMNRT